MSALVINRKPCGCEISLFKEVLEKSLQCVEEFFTMENLMLMEDIFRYLRCHGKIGEILDYVFERFYNQKNIPKLIILGIVKERLEVCLTPGACVGCTHCISRYAKRVGDI